jgi:hypothetical protein
MVYDGLVADPIRGSFSQVWHEGKGDEFAMTEYPTGELPAG